MVHRQQCVARQTAAFVRAHASHMHGHPDAASLLAIAASYKLLLPLVPDLCPAQLGCLHLHEQSRARHTVDHT